MLDDVGPPNSGAGSRRRFRRGQSARAADFCPRFWHALSYSVEFESDFSSLFLTRHNGGTCRINLQHVYRVRFLILKSSRLDVG
ncbi:hypothetical protein [Burkholderia sp. SCN-KJ]|uniref:hypothetical protein n=1 Tax=Burkholderia sp. SCN-KJ TaxID=2969248 RepID=UPI0021500445|nr:hypothetical protein [Burkholderia sp. SCN-KJ]MCR4470423.1 hypothetical protein [Burkholderia sp. SCN-KJ]